MLRTRLILILVMICTTGCATGAPTPVPTRFPALQPTAMGDLKLTILDDNTTTDPQLASEWGFAAVVQYAGHTLLFDTGTDGALLLNNMRQLKVDPQSIEAVILSHQHTDHTGGLQALLDTGVRPTVYVPTAFAESFKRPLRKQTQLVEVSEATEIMPGIHTPRPVGSIIEQGLVVETRDGLVVITGCAHPGVAEMVRQAQAVVDGKIVLLIGGFHLYQQMESALPPVVAEIRQLGVEGILPAHCTGDAAMALFQKEYGATYIEGGVGRTVTFPAQ